MISSKSSARRVCDVSDDQRTMRAAHAMRPSLAARTRTAPLALSATTRFVSMGGTPKGPTKKTTLYKQMAALTKSASTGDLGRTLGVGGADAILADLVRRVFSSRLLPSEAVEKYGASEHPG